MAPTPSVTATPTDLTLPPCPQAVLPLVARIAGDAAGGVPEPAPGTSHTAALVCVLRAARQLQVGQRSTVCAPGGPGGRGA